MNSILYELKDKFKLITEKINNIEIIFTNIEEKITRLSEFYKELCKSNKKKILILGLDTLHFQNQLIKQEKSNFYEYYQLIINRTYSDYLKIAKIIRDYINMNIKSQKIIENSKFL